MRFAYPLRGNRPPQKRLLAALQAGVALYGDEIVPTTIDSPTIKPAPDHDGVILLGISGLYEGIDNRMVFNAYRKAGKRVLLFDKGYVRRAFNRTDYLRVSVDSFQPHAYLHHVNRPTDRLEQLHLHVQPYQPPPKGRLHTRHATILFDGASQKYCDWHGLGNHVDWIVKTIKHIQSCADMSVMLRLKKITYIPKGMLPNRVILSHRELDVDMLRATIVVSHGGNIGWDAMIYGRPHFAIGPSIARAVSQTEWLKLEEPYVPSDADRQQLMANAAYCQWSIAELADGSAWAIIKEQLAQCRSIGHASSNNTVSSIQTVDAT